MCCPPTHTYTHAHVHNICMAHQKQCRCARRHLGSARSARSHGCLLLRPFCCFGCAAPELSVYGSVLSCLLFFVTVDSKTGLIMLEILLSPTPRHHFFISSPPPSPTSFFSPLSFLKDSGHERKNAAAYFSAFFPFFSPPAEFRSTNLL